MKMKDIAIIGIAGRFPDAGNLAEFRRNLIQGKDSVKELSMERRLATTLPLDKTYMECGFIEGIENFDHKFFHISRSEAEHMDPHQRLLLEVVYETIESAGYNVDFFNGTETAIYIGDTEQEYYRLAERFDPTLLTGSTSAATAGRIARFFNFRGNAAMVDTACSSSLLAAHMACNDLTMGEADYALACGVRIMLFPEEKNGAPDMGIMSADGKTRSFSANANGTGAGEAVGCVLLKPLDKALADGDIIYAVIKGTSVNQDAQLSGSLTAPSSKAQAEVIQKSWKKGKIDPATVSYIEAHGSGTKLGDPIEIAGIDQAFKEFTNNRHFCAVSSVKSNIGHTGAAAGICGLIKVVLSLQYKELYPSLHFDQPNPLIDFKNSVVYINREYKAWENSFPRRAGVSSFGLSGTNCHVLLEEAPPAKEGNNHSGTFLFNLSARSAGSLEAYIKNFSEYIYQNDSPSLADISYTLNAGRKHYPHRVSVIASSREELIQKMTGSASYQAPGIVTKIIFLFSGDSIVSDQLLATAGNNHTELGKYINECAPYYTTSDAAINRFVFQYALYRFLEEKGLTTEHLLGIGNGDLVVSVILNELSLEEAIGRCHTEETYTADLNKRLIGLVERETEESRVAFVEIGPPGCLSKGLQQLNYPDKDVAYSVIQMEHSPLEIWQGLYLQQYPVDWATYYAQSDYRKVALPAYQFEKVRCWLKPRVADSAQGKSDGTSTLKPGNRENWSDMERKIADIWMEVLNLDTISLEDDFFRLGGHSLMATKVISMIERDFGIKLVFKDIFTFATVKALAKGVGALVTNGAQASVYHDIQPAPEQACYPLSWAQRRLWLISQSNSNNVSYNLPAALLLEGSLDADKLEAVFRALINRHESLRTSFHEKNAQPVQVVHKEVSFSIQRITTSAKADDVLKDFIQPFDLTRAPLLRVALATLTPGKYLLLLDMHHIISDGVSMALFTNELVQLYNNGELSPLKIQYKDFVVWQQELFSNGAMDKQEHFWLQQFSSGAPLLNLKTDKQRPAVPSFAGDKVIFELTAEQVQQINSLAFTTGTTPFMILLAVYTVLLHKYTSQEDIVVGVPVAGRSHTALDNMIGMFVNTIVLRNRPAKGKTFARFLEEVKINSLQAYENQDYPFALLVDKLDMKKDASRNPLFDAAFALQNMEIPQMRLHDLTVSAYPVNTGASPFDLYLEITESKGHWPVKLEYNTSLFKEVTILLMKERFITLLSDVLADPMKPIGELSIRIAAEMMHEGPGLDVAFNFQ
jgi:3-oxoacyl-(acyl-carrier-protein) synthase/acyl carrier protein